MARKRDFRVLVATDGSRPAQAAITTAIQFPWPDGSRVRVVIARNLRAEHRRSILLAAMDRSCGLGHMAIQLLRLLARCASLPPTLTTRNCAGHGARCGRHREQQQRRGSSGSDLGRSRVHAGLRLRPRLHRVQPTLDLGAKLLGRIACGRNRRVGRRPP